MRPRSSSVSNILFAALTGLSVLGWAPVARAEDDTQVQAARVRFQEGVKYYDGKQYAKARVAFTQAYALKPHPSVLLNLAQSELRSGHEADAANHFSRYLREVDANAPTRKEAERGLAQAKQKACEVVVKVSSDGAQVLLDGQAQGTSPLDGPVYVAPGAHSFEAKLGNSSITAPVEAAAGQSQEVTLSLSGKDASTGSAESASSKPKGAKGEQPREGDAGPDVTGPGRPSFFGWVFGKPLGLTLAGLTVVGLGVGTAFVIMGANEGSSAKAIEKNIIYHYTLDYPQGGSPCNPPPNMDYWNECKRYMDTDDRKKRYNTIGFIGLGVGAAALASTIVLYFVTTSSGEGTGRAPSRNTRRTAFEIVPVALPSWQGLTVSGRF